MELPQERRITGDIPGPRSRELLERRDRAVPAAIWSTVPVFVERASGAIVEDVDGNRFIDFGAGLAVLNLGNAPPDVVEAIRDQAGRYTHTCFHVTMGEPYVALAERLNELTPGTHEKRTMLANSGAEAVENAVKIARYVTKRPRVVAFDHAFHGRTLLAMSMTAKEMPYKAGFEPYATDVHRLPYAYPYRCPAGAPPARCGEACAERAIAEMRRIGPASIAAVVIEPVQGEGGFIVPGQGFIPALHEYCAQEGIVFVADEVQTGFGRTGRWFGIEHEGVVPDMVLTAKALGSGLPISGVTARADLVDRIHVGGLGGTFGGNPVAASGALATIDAMERDAVPDRANAVGDTIRAALDGMQERHAIVGDVRGRGAMMAIELVEDRDEKTPAKQAASRVIEECYGQGLILLKAGTYDNVVRLLPPLTIDTALLEEGLEILEKAVALAAT